MLKQRIITALALLPVALGGVFLLPLTPFSVFIAVVIALAAWEWAGLAGFTNQLVRVGYAALTGGMIFLLSLASAGFLLGAGLTWWLMALMLVISYPDSRVVWQNRIIRLLMGWLVLLPAWGGLVYLKGQPQGNLLILYVFLLVWAADVGAYFAGRAFGQRKLAPSLSPGKTWEGVFGGLLMTSLIALLVGWYQQLNLFECLGLVAITLVVTMVSVLGDLLESMFKREAGLKDSSQLLPGHGGVMDRIDSLTAAIPVFAVFWFLAMAT
ncbi:phosphatidate cytidylyltransferase [Kistimonas asteriae]|uniref:phosphatidate cytidylyltransferase n=1 Tax=Kistimonas asteriae TaxID=517724 RepID=UPI001BAB8B83